MRAAFAGTPDFALPALAALREQHQVVGVLTQPDRPSGRGRHLSASPVKQAAVAARLPLAQPATLATAADRAALTAWQPDVLVVVAYGLKLPHEVLALPKFGCINIHASLLPRWRGAAPIQRAIQAGDTHTGITIMQMDEGLDTGPMLLQRRIALTREHTGGSLHDELAPLGAQALLETLAGVCAGSLPATLQPATGVTYAARISKAEARIDWGLDAVTLERQVRAFNPWPVAQTLLNGEPLKIWQARATPRVASATPGSVLLLEEGRLLVACGEGQLAIERLQCAGRRVVSAADFAHGHATDGLRFG